jgi:hypothetical protein
VSSSTWLERRASTSSTLQKCEDTEVLALQFEFSKVFQEMRPDIIFFHSKFFIIDLISQVPSSSKGRDSRKD